MLKKQKIIRESEFISGIVGKQLQSLSTSAIMPQCFNIDLKKYDFKNESKFIVNNDENTSLSDAFGET